METPAQLPQRPSTIVIPVGARLADLERSLNQRIPQDLWQINKPGETCVPPQRLKILGRRVKVTPTIRCTIVGRARRGVIRLSGSGDELVISLPVSATVSAQDVGGIIKRETATGSAIVRARAKLSVDRNWTPTAKVEIAYDWTEPPGIDFLGRRIRFVEKADEKLQGVIASLERSLPQELAKMRARERLSDLWSKGFTSVMLNRERPPVWMRLTPQQLGFGGYEIRGGELRMMLAADVITETFVGDRPANPQQTPLPPPARKIGKEGLRFFIPVLADYRQLEPVMERALLRLARKGITLKGVGPVDAEFGKVTIYATEGGRLAVGIKAKVRARTTSLATTQGEVWLSAIPFNGTNSQLVRVRDLQMTRNIDSTAVNLLLELFGDEQVREIIRTSLVHDFAGDYQKVLTAARKAISERRQGNFVMNATVTDVTNGQIQVTGQGLFLPVEANGEARILYRPALRSK